MTRLQRQVFWKNEEDKKYKKCACCGTRRKLMVWAGSQNRQELWKVGMNLALHTHTGISHLNLKIHLHENSWVFFYYFWMYFRKPYRHVGISYYQHFLIFFDFAELFEFKGFPRRLSIRETSSPYAQATRKWFRVCSACGEIGSPYAQPAGKLVPRMLSLF